MKHFLMGLRVLERPLRKCLLQSIDVCRGLRCAQVSVAPGPIRTSQSRRAQAHPSTEYDDDEREHRADERDATKGYERMIFHDLSC
jgi:hypothetical protein